MERDSPFPLLLLLLLFFSSCLGVRYVSNTSPSGKVLEEFFVKPGVMQYFVKPHFWTNNFCDISTDFTFRDSAGVKTLVTANITVPDYKPDSFSIGVGPQRIISSIETLFEERRSRKIFRVSAKIPFDSFRYLVSTDQKIVLIGSDSNGVKKNQTFIPKNRSKKILKKIGNYLFTRG